MNNFKVGDKVIRVRDDYNGMYINDIATVVEIVSSISIRLLEYEGYHDPLNFSLYTPDNELKYHLNYVEDSETKRASFNSKEEMIQFINFFRDKYGSLDDGSSNWIELDSFVYGKKLKLNTTYTVE